jgi:hypothetical protein
MDLRKWAPPQLDEEILAEQPRSSGRDPARLEGLWTALGPWWTGGRPDG